MLYQLVETKAPVGYAKADAHVDHAQGQRRATRIIKLRSTKAKNIVDGCGDHRR